MGALPHPPLSFQFLNDVVFSQYLIVKTSPDSIFFQITLAIHYLSQQFITNRKLSYCGGTGIYGLVGVSLETCIWPWLMGFCYVLTKAVSDHKQLVQY